MNEGRYMVLKRKETMNAKQLEALFEASINGQEANAYRELLIRWNNYPELFPMDKPINPKTLKKVIEKISNKWEREIDKYLFSEE